MTEVARATANGVSLEVEVKVRASNTRVLGVKAGRLSVALAAPPVDGAANDALCRALAEHFELPRSRVQIRSGKQSRRKIVDLEGAKLAEVLARIAHGAG